MKSKVLIGLFAIMAISIVALPITRDELRWQWASIKDTSNDYVSYLASWPNGRHSEEARPLYDERSWSYATTSSTVEGFKKSMLIHPEGKYVSEARDKIEDFHWKQATDDNKIKSYQAYLDAYPQGRFASEANTRRAFLRKDDTPFLRAQKMGSGKALQTFLSEFPGHKREGDARSALKDMEGRDIVALIRKKKVEVETQGSGIRSVRVKIRRLVPHRVTVLIPVGTFFVSRNRSSQNMVTTAQTKRTFTTAS